MFRLREPDRPAIEEFLAGQAELPFSYAPVGASRDAERLRQLPGHFVLDENRTRLGAGPVCFELACQALRRWEMFQVGFARLLWPEAPLVVGTTVGVLARAMGLWSLNAARIVYLIDEHEAGVQRFGFAYGTLPDHVAEGEERFCVAWLAADDSVWYELRAFSRPSHPLARLGRPYTRAVQRRFSAASLRAMALACSVPEADRLG